MMLSADALELAPGVLVGRSASAPLYRCGQQNLIDHDARLVVDTQYLQSIQYTATPALEDGECGSAALRT